MEFCYFVKTIEAMVKEKCQDKHVEVDEVYKNNGVKCTGITVEKNDGMAPVVYLEEYYEDYNKGRTLENIVETILDLSSRYRVRECDNVKSMMQGFDRAKDNLYIMVVNKERNQGLLRRTPHEEILDLAAVCLMYIDIGVAECGQEGASGKAIVTDKLLDIWGITKEELFRAAKKNSKNIMPPEVEPMEKMMYDLLMRKLDNILHGEDEAYERLDEDEKSEMLGMLKGEFTEIVEHMRKDLPSMMYVITNQWKINGAGLLADEEFMAELAKKIGHSFYIIPSSVHEFLAITDKEENMDIEGMKSTIKYVNANEVSEDEFLSDNLYRYNMEEGRLEIVER